MTRPHHRRDQHVKYASVLTGLRCERELAQKLCDFARDNVRANPDAPVSRVNPGNVAEAVRYLMRRGLVFTHDQAERVEVVERKGNVGIPGLTLDSETDRRLRAYERQLGLGRAGSVRHLLRLQLGFSKQDSLQREEHFAAIAAAKHEVMSA